MRSSTSAIQSHLFEKVARFWFRNRFMFGLYALLSLFPKVEAGDFLIHDGDRVVFLGDSITEQRLYTTFIEAYALTRQPRLHHFELELSVP